VVEERPQSGGFVPGGGSDGVLRLTILLAVQLEVAPLLCLRHRPMVKNGVEQQRLAVSAKHRTGCERGGQGLCSQS
jgi:hypothetical protein